MVEWKEGRMELTEKVMAMTEKVTVMKVLVSMMEAREAVSMEPKLKRSPREEREPTKWRQLEEE